MNWIQDDTQISTIDLENVFKYEEKETTVITWSTNDTSPVVHQLEDSAWEGWLQNKIRAPSPKCSSCKQAKDWMNFLYCVDKTWILDLPAPAGNLSPSTSGRKPGSLTALGGQRYLRTVPFSRATFRQITDGFRIHGSISTVISRADVPVFSSTQVQMDGDTAYVYNCRSSNDWGKDLALTVTHLPDSQTTFCIMFGCDKSIEEAVISRLSAIGSEISHPLIMPAILVELERLRHKRITAQAIASLETNIAELDFDTDKLDEESGPGTVGDRNSVRRSTWLDTAYLQNGLVNWCLQLGKLRNCVVMFDGDNQPITVASAEITSNNLPSYVELYQANRSKGTGRKIVARIEAIEEEYAQIVRDCKMRLEGMSMATQWAQGETNMAIAKATSRDSKHMRAIAFITMIFLPGTFLAGVFSMSFFNWQTSDASLVSTYFWVYVVIAVFLTLLTVGSWWVSTTHRRKKIRTGFNDKIRKLQELPH
ncbi:hypothetical protein PG997_005325 [Apiospora hydei]|uniref:Uncharacterized protein n=1 Tax=Apiospora hydei TaxID=1337664 RepID=A0ABR1X4T8_9PEZI